jgi:acyl-coenzyme A thioesterase PaaI-like protein
MINRPQIPKDIDKECDLCFACGQKNPAGLKLIFTWDGKVARAEFTPSKLHQGWPGVMHGGIIGCILDEAMSYAALFEGANTLTAKMETKFRRPVKVGETLIIAGWATKKNRRLVEAKAEIRLKDGTPVADSTAIMFVIGKAEQDVHT